ncbi:hypothetical protein Pcinc_004327 [Petrolisthes cinctipes]|uniref:Uncharacterized protein n=1 Tax=Petrolisthes cinctipes TaxID=88211 RepID=A0AAE1L1L4_PETCI|nr:hypothetical protein Pcinc_004327 [Petrolisthes cinctipes]
MSICILLSSQKRKYSPSSSARLRMFQSPTESVCKRLSKCANHREIVGALTFFMIPWFLKLCPAPVTVTGYMRVWQDNALARLTILANEAENTRLDLNDKIIALTRKLESLEEFRQHKEELEGKMAALEKELAFNKEQHQEKEAQFCIFLISYFDNIELS